MFALVFPSTAQAASTMTLPDYGLPLLTPESQATAAWRNVIPNALATYFTYVPYSNADAMALGFPSVCGNPSRAGATAGDLASTEDCYTITVKKFPQRLALPGIFGGGPGLLRANGVAFGDETQVYGYGSGGANWTPPGASVSVTGNAPKSFVDGTYGTAGIWHFPGPTVKATHGRPVRIQWLNELPNTAPVGLDPTVDCGPNAPYCYPYNRIVTHLHGAHVMDDSDGYTLAWFTPLFATTGPGWTPSTYGPEGTYRYPMDQEAGTLWYHDHAMGTTHNNTQMGMAGFFPVTDANEQSLITANVLPTGNYELGFALQDRMFDVNGQFAMPDYPVYDLTSPGCTLTPDGLADPATCMRLDWMKAADGHLIPYVAGDPLLSNANNADAPYGAPSTTLEYFGNMPVVNGVTYGKYDVEPRVYRMRFIGGSDSRTWIMKLVRRDTGAVIPFWQVGSEQGLLDSPVERTSIDLLPGERVDVLVNLRGIPVGTAVVMQNIGPDDPYAGPDDPAMVPSVDIPEIMEFKVVALSGLDNITTPSSLTSLRTPVVPLTPTPGTPVRNLSLVEGTDEYGRTTPTIDGREFMMEGVPTTEVIKLNDVEQWDIINTTVDAHPIHLHLVAFQVINRQLFDPATFVPAVTDTTGGVFAQPQYANAAGSAPVAAPAWEAGWKDTVDAPPGMVTRVRAKFDIAGDKYVWHCHILSHEEHDMMRPFSVAASPVVDPLTLAFIADSNGTVSGAVSQSGVYGFDGTTVTAVPKPGYRFERWSGTGGFVTTAANPLTVTNVTASQTITAHFSLSIVWREQTGGSLYSWELAGSNQVAGEYLSPASVPTTWKIAGTGDFDGNGTADLLWRESSSGSLYVWYMNGSTRSGGAYLSPSAVPMNWEIAGIRDFNADGKPDLLWRDTAGGFLYLWHMNGVTRDTGTYLSPNSVPLNWRIAGTGDFNADGKPDILWQESTSGYWYVWYMNMATRVGGDYLNPSQVSTNWAVTAIGDLNGDGKPDLLWREKAAGSLYVWYMDGVLKTGEGYASPALVSTAWQIEGYGSGK